MKYKKKGFAVLVTPKPFSWRFPMLYNIAMTLSIGEKLRQERLVRKLSLEQVAQQTRIRLRYLEALEKGDLDALPSLTQARGFTRAYAQFLKIDPEPLLANLSGEKVADSSNTSEAPAPVESLQGAQADAILANLGAKLRQQRELLGLSVEDVERHIHIRAHYLSALEAGNLANLPSPVQGRGMLNNYAIFLGFDPEPLLLNFAEGLQANLAARQAARASTLPAKTRKSSNRSKTRRFFSIDLLAGGFLIIFIVGFVLWGALRISTVRSEDQPTPTSPSIAEVLVPDTATPGPSATLQPNSDPSATIDLILTQSTPQIEQTTELQETQLIANPPQITPTSTLPPFDASSVQVYIVIRQRAWVRVIVDGTVELDGRVLPGSAYLFTGNELIEILTGNGAALQVYFNQQDQGIMGQFGEIVNIAYAPSGVVQPIATPTSLPTATAQPASTPTPTLTPTSLP